MKHLKNAEIKNSEEKTECISIIGLHQASWYKKAGRLMTKQELRTNNKK